MIEIKNKTNASADIVIYGEIGESYSGESVTAKRFAKLMQDAGDVPLLNIYINSPGGNVWDAVAIHSMLKRKQATKAVYIDGLAASAASIVAMAGDTVTMPVNAMLMIHRAWSVAAGNTAEFAKVSDMLARVDESISETYAARTGMDKDEVLTLMDSETWLTAEDAVSRGFADTIDQERKVAASLQGGFFYVNGERHDISRYRNVPQIEAYAPQQPDDSGDVSRPVANSEQLARLRLKLVDAYKEGKK